VSHIDVLVLDLLVHQIGSPDADALVVDGQQLGVRVVVEGDLVGGVGADWVTAERLSRGNLNLKVRFENIIINSYIPDHERIIVLSSQGSQVLFIV
jgi:hypothetical protein